MGCATGKPKAARKLSLESNTIMKDIQKGKLQNYEFKKLLGQGRFGRVLLGKRCENGQLVAIKAIAKTKAAVSLSQLMKEIEILSQVDHPNIVKYLEHFETEQYLYIVMEYCSGGDLFTKIVNRDKFSEAEAASLMAEILRAVNHCHHLGLIHRDLKPENIMYSEEGQIKIIDFGLSMHEKGFSQEKVAGTAYYIAPEILMNEIFIKACDIWSLGIILHILLSGYVPIVGVTPEETYDKIMSYKGPSFTGEVWRSVSKEGKDLVQKMLDPDYTKRITAAEALKHSWFATKRGEDQQLDPGIIQALKQYSGYSKLKKKVLNLLVHNINEMDIKRLQAAFLALDKEQTGLITCLDIEACLKKEGYEMRTEELESLTRRVNYNGEAFINYTEFLAATLSAQSFLTEEKLRCLFKYLDVEQRGSITEENLKTVLSGRQRIQSSEVAVIMRDADTNHDGKITFDEFKSIFNKDLLV